MKFLLDTHAVLWWLSDDNRLGPAVRSAIADTANDVLVSVVSLWEIALKVRVGKLQVDLGATLDAISTGGFTTLGVNPSHLRALATLPWFPDHRDPFDHLLVAQAIVEGAVFASDDRNASRYPTPFVRCSASQVA